MASVSVHALIPSPLARVRVLPSLLLHMHALRSGIFGTSVRARCDSTLDSPRATRSSANRAALGRRYWASSVAAAPPFGHLVGPTVGGSPRSVSVLFVRLFVASRCVALPRRLVASLPRPLHRWRVHLLLLCCCSGWLLVLMFCSGAFNVSPALVASTPRNIRTRHTQPQAALATLATQLDSVSIGATLVRHIFNSTSRSYRVVSSRFAVFKATPAAVAPAAAAAASCTTPARTCQETLDGLSTLLSRRVAPCRVGRRPRRVNKQ